MTIKLNWRHGPVRNGAGDTFRPKEDERYAVIMGESGKWGVTFVGAIIAIEDSLIKAKKIVVQHVTNRLTLG